MAGKGVALTGMFERVPDDFDLTVIEQVRSADFRFHFLVFGRLSFDVSVKILDRLADHLNLSDEKVTQIIVVRLRVEEGFAILDGGFSKSGRDGNEFEEPISVAKHRPIEQRPRRSAVAVHKGMIVGQPKMEKNRSDDRMNITVMGLAVVGKSAHFFIRSESSSAGGGEW